ncbi:methyl-accepting chemotaxis protein [Sphaerotilus mobilis]|uniref:Methyl-accepting chemotaxis protein n=1 Tax=Sphaerotilus mobilis TaxID=47994 RepID=A0A4Q7LV59_9BURK|nr:methyl-accepting chemotaxis protein [Sphaerotilus mobilis]RZS58162.1 methyl-accepting chemotaxis protein [Sphaerotilus mobilis]
MPSSSNPFFRNSNQVDLLIATVLGCHAALALLLCDRAGLTTYWWLWVAAIAPLTLLALWRWRGTVTSRSLLGFGLVSAIFLQGATGASLTGGDHEIYMGMLVTAGLLSFYRSWRYIVAVTFWLLVSTAVIQAGLVPTVHPGMSYSVLALLATQGALQALIARWDEHRERERFDIEFLIRAMGREGPIRLSLDVVKAESALGARLKHVQERMAAAMRQVSLAAGGVSDASAVLGDSSRELMNRTETSAAGLQDAAMCLDQITVIVQSSAEATQEARKMAARASGLAAEGGEIFEQVIAKMAAIDSASRQITDIVAVIDGIAFQTNILALNAAVEAARAGEQGRGFSVVAAEVRNLALRASESAREVKQLIGHTVDTVESGTSLVNAAGQTMKDVVSSVRQVGEVFENLSADTSEHAAGINAVTQSVKELDEVTRQNVAVAERANEIAKQLHEHAERLTRVLSSFQLGTAQTSGRALDDLLIGAPAQVR